MKLKKIKIKSCYNCNNCYKFNKPFCRKYQVFIEKDPSLHRCKKYLDYWTEKLLTRKRNPYNFTATYKCIYVDVPFISKNNLDATIFKGWEHRPENSWHIYILEKNIFVYIFENPLEYAQWKDDLGIDESDLIDMNLLIYDGRYSNIESYTYLFKSNFIKYLAQYWKLQYGDTKL